MRKKDREHFDALISNLTLEVLRLQQRLGEVEENADKAVEADYKAGQALTNSIRNMDDIARLKEDE